MTSLDRFVPFAAILASALAACTPPTAQSNTLDPPMARATATEAAPPGSGEIVETPVAPPMVSAAPATATPEAKAAASAASAPAVT